MKVFVVTYNSWNPAGYDDVGVEKIFFKEEAAKAYCDANNDPRSSYATKYEYEEKDVE